MPEVESKSLFCAAKVNYGVDFSSRLINACSYCVCIDYGKKNKAIMLRPDVAGHKCVTVSKRDRLWFRFLLEEIKYLICLFRCSCVEAKRGVELRHSTRNASRIP